MYNKKVMIIFLFFFLLTGCSEEDKKLQSNVDRKMFNVKESNNVEISTDAVEEKKKESKKEINNDSNVAKEDDVTDYQAEVTNYSNADNEAISTFATLEQDVDNLLASGSGESVKSKAKGVFITIVDFIFYDGQINGITFNELTDAGKEKVLSIASSIDQKIENKFPNYKTSITDTTSKAFTRASELIKAGAQNINNFAQEKLGEEYYNEIINSKDELVDYTKNALSIIGDIGGNLLTKGKDTLSSWYDYFKSNY